MTQKDIESKLSRSGKHPFVTVTDIAERMGTSTKTVSRRLNKMDVNAIDGKYYLAKDIAEGLAARLQKRGTV